MKMAENWSYAATNQELQEPPDAGTGNEEVPSRAFRGAVALPPLHFGLLTSRSVTE